MKYLKKYKFIIERKDLEKREEINDLLNDIVIIIKNHFIKITDNILTGKNNIEDYITNIDNYSFNKEVLKIPVKNKKFYIKIKKFDSNKTETTSDISGGSYSRQNTIKPIAKNEFKLVKEYILTISMNNFYDLIKKIFITKKQYLPKLKKDIARYRLSNDEKITLFHELVHAYDDMKYDIFNDIKKWSKVVALHKSGKNFKDKEYSDEYYKNYVNSNSEYNAYFLQSVDKLLNLLKKGDIKWNQIEDFDTFKDFFIILSLNHFDFYGKTTKFKKHYDKRMYDLYTKLKEKYDNKN